MPHVIERLHLVETSDEHICRLITCLVQGFSWAIGRHITPQLLLKPTLLHV